MSDQTTSETTSDLLDVIELLAAALNAAWVELETLDDLHIPLPDELYTKLEERKALSMTLKAITESGELRQAAEKIYRDEFAKATVSSPELRAPVSDDVLREVREAIEIVRRRRLLVPDLRDLALPLVD